MSLGTDMLAAATTLLNQDNITALASELKNRAEALKARATTAVNDLNTEEGRKQAMDQGIEGLSAALDYFRTRAVADLQLVGSKAEIAADYAYQNTLGSAQAEGLYNQVMGITDSETRQRKLEKILYLYILDQGFRQTPEVDVTIMTPEQRQGFFKSLLNDETRRDQIREMVRNLLYIFNSRLGTSAVQYGHDEVTNDAEVAELHRQIIDDNVRGTLAEEIDERVDNINFLESFMRSTVDDFQSGEANDSKYFGASPDTIDMLHRSIYGFIQSHNRYVLEYIKSGDGLRREKKRLDKLDATISELEATMEDGEVSAMRTAIENMRKAIDQMLNVQSDGTLRVYQLGGLDSQLAGVDTTTGDVIIVQVQGKKRAAAGDDAPIGGSASTGVVVGGKRRTRKRMLRKYRKKGTKKRARKSGKRCRRGRSIKKTKRKIKRRRRKTRKH